MPNVTDYDPSEVAITINGIPITGFADGEFITVERDNDSFSDMAGSDGEVTRSKSSDRRATATLTLMQSSASNDYLSSLAALDEVSGSGAFAFGLADISGRTVISGERAWIVKPAATPFAKEVSNRQWTIRIADADIAVGGNRAL